MGLRAERHCKEASRPSPLSSGDEPGFLSSFTDEAVSTDLVLLPTPSGLGLIAPVRPFPPDVSEYRRGEADRSLLSHTL